MAPGKAVPFDHGIMIARPDFAHGGQEEFTMGNKMLIDATHPEETRVVVTRGNRVEEFDYESASRKQLRGNIYLAKMARIEPSFRPLS